MILVVMGEEGPGDGICSIVTLKGGGAVCCVCQVMGEHKPWKDVLGGWSGQGGSMGRRARG